MEDNQKFPQNPNILFCNKCNYYCSHKGDWHKHIRTAKHLNDKNGNNIESTNKLEDRGIFVNVSLLKIFNINIAVLLPSKKIKINPNNELLDLLAINHLEFDFKLLILLYLFHLILNYLEHI